jgi:hypothetical protein
VCAGADREEDHITGSGVARARCRGGLTSRDTPPVKTTSRSVSLHDGDDHAIRLCWFADSTLSDNSQHWFERDASARTTAP